MRVGITHFAQDALGDIVYVSLPEVGRPSTAGEPCGEAGVDQVGQRHLRPGHRRGGRAQRGARRDQPELVNTDPYGAGWLFEIVPADRVAVDGLLDAAAYQARSSG